MSPPPLTELLARYLAAPGGSEPGADVVPHEVLTAFRVDARTAWSEAKEAITLFGGEKPDLRQGPFRLGEDNPGLPPPPTKRQCEHSESGRQQAAAHRDQ